MLRMSVVVKGSDAPPAVTACAPLCAETVCLPGAQQDFSLAEDASLVNSNFQDQWRQYTQRRVD